MHLAGSDEGLLEAKYAWLVVIDDRDSAFRIFSF